jgi:hypothetical protein
MVLAISAVFVCLLAFSLIAAQKEQSGLFHIEGVVCDSATGDPIPGVLVQVLSQKGPDSTALRTRDSLLSTETPVKTSTGADGRFQIEVPVLERAIDAPVFLVFVRQGYINRTLSYAVIQNETVTSPLVRLTKIGIISGRLLDSNGQPAAAATVTAYRYQGTENGRQLMWTGRILTDDRGEFRLFDLAPGRYFLGFAGKGNTLGNAVPDPLKMMPALYARAETLSAAQLVEVQSGGETALGTIA